MAAENRSPPSQPASPCTTQGHTSAPDWLKLRNSCGACASSKLKCSQEKPTCSRCAKRGTTCEYVVAKRGGRKPKNRSSVTETSYSMNAPHLNSAVDMNANMLFSSSSANWFAPPSSPGSTQHTPWRNISGSSDILHDLFSPLYENLSTTSMDAGVGLDDYFTTPTFSTEIPDMNLFATADLFPSTTNSSSTRSTETLADAFTASDDAVSQPSSLSCHSSLLGRATSFIKDTHNADEESRRTAQQPSCSCLVQALGFMKRLFASNNSGACSAWTRQGLDKTTIILSIQAVIAQNKATIEAVSTMLQCSCSQDGYLLAITSLIVFKVLNWYAVVARKASSLQDLSVDGCSRQPSPSHEHQQQQQQQQSKQSQQQVSPNPTVIGEYCLGGADSARMAAQLILSELHQVRRLVDQLSAKLKMQGPKSEKTGGGDADETTLERIDLLQEMTLPLSASMYNHLDVDLRKQLRTLSSEMIDRLRKL